MAEKSTYYEVTTVQRLTNDGIGGIWLFILSPIVHASGLWMVGDLFSVWTMLLSIACAVGFLGGFVLLLAGRDYVAYHRSP